MKWCSWGFFHFFQKILYTNSYISLTSRSKTVLIMLCIKPATKQHSVRLWLAMVVQMDCNAADSQSFARQLPRRWWTWCSGNLSPISNLRWPFSGAVLKSQLVIGPETAWQPVFWLKACKLPSIHTFLHGNYYYFTPCLFLSLCDCTGWQAQVDTEQAPAKMAFG